MAYQTYLRFTGSLIIASLRSGYEPGNWDAAAGSGLAASR
jgi:hypothetical protein